MEKILTRLSNTALWATWNLGFRPGFSPKLMRRYFDVITSTENFILKPGDARIESTHWNSVPVDVVETTAQPQRTILYLHGGGYFMGTIRGYRKQGYDLAAQCNARVVLAEYRLAPEFPYPAGLDDAMKVYRELLVRYPNDTVIVGGDSAGGGLTLALLQRLRDEKLRLPARAFCISPWADVTGSGASMSFNHDKDAWLSKRHLDAWGPWYCAGLDARTPGISPVFGDFKGLPPLLLFVGDQEVLLDDSVRVAERALAAGARAEVVMGKGMQHDWFLILPWLQESKTAMNRLVSFVMNGFEA